MSSWRIRGPQRLRGRVQVPGDKSISHRALLLGAVAQGQSRVRGFVRSRDCLATLGLVRALGVEVVEVEGDDGELVIHGRGFAGLSPPAEPLDCGSSGTTMRITAGLLAGRPFACSLVGSQQLSQRPMARVVEPLRRLGAAIEARPDGRPPLRFEGRREGGQLHGRRFELPIASAQVKSALLLAGLQATGETVVAEPAPSRDHTERMLLAMGAPLRRDPAAGQVSVHGLHEPLRPLELEVPGDPSSAAFFLAAQVMCSGSEVEVARVSQNPTRTGFQRALQRLGCEVQVAGQTVSGGEPLAERVTVRAADLRGIELGGAQIPALIDEVPLLALVASQAPGPTTVGDAGELRVKETDRIAVTVSELSKLGVPIAERPAGFVVQGSASLVGAQVSSHGDHRLAMLLTVAGLAARGETVVDDVDCVADSYPGFLADLRALGAEVEER